MQPKQFRIPTDRISNMTKKALFNLLPVLILGVGGGLLIAYNLQDGPVKDYTTLMFVIPLMAVYIAYAAYNGMKRQKALFSTYVLTIHSNSIKREQHGMPSINLYFSEIKQILKLKDGSFHVRAKDSSSSFMVPSTIEQYEEVERLLQGIMPIERSVTYGLLHKYVWAPAMAMIGLMVAVYLSSNRLLVTVCGTVAIGIMVWGLIVGRKSKSIDQKTKRGLWWLVLVLFSVAARMVTVWLN